jgi:hypothetical protein
VTGFLTSARRVRDTDLAARGRVLALRECVLRFPPYGFRATWHHLILSANVPTRIDDDPLSLRRAVDELEQARLVWQAHSADHLARRRLEKAAGRRTPSRADHWFHRAGLIAYCPDFRKHPTERLAVVVRRVIAAYEAGVDQWTTCRACGRSLTADYPCPGCGVDPSPAARRPEFRTLVDHHRWREVWQRSPLRTAR